MRNTSTFSILFYPRTNARDDNFRNLHVRITYNSKRADISLKHQIDFDNWDSKRSRMKGNSSEAKRINQYINQINSEIFEAYDDLRKNDETLSSEAIKARYLKEDINSHTLIEMIDYHYNLALNMIKEGTLKNYRTTEKYIKLFLQDELKSNDIKLDRIKYSFLTRFENYLRMHEPVDHQQKLGNNTVMKHLQRLRKIVSMAVRLEWIEKDPFASFRASYQRKDREFLSAAELEAIETKALSIERLVYVRDLFVFSCYTGLAYIDTINLTEDNLVLGIDGGRWIYTRRQKTEMPVKVPILEQAELLIDKYKNHPKSIYNGTIFPKISNQKLNSYLKEIADLCGIKKNITFHLARHTFATTVTLSNGVPLATVSKLLGHAKITSTQIYAKVIESKVSEDMKLLKDQLAFKKNQKPDGADDNIKKIS